MPYNVRIVSTYPPRKCGIGTFSRDLTNALEYFSEEVNAVHVAAIDKDNNAYSVPVDIVIDQYDPKSWRRAVRDISARAGESPDPTVVILQHEYGLDPDEKGNDCDGTNFVAMARAFAEKKLTTLVYLHTVVDEPNEHQQKVLKRLAEYSDGVIVTTESAVRILESDKYGVEHEKVKHIDHGIRMHNPSSYDRLTIKESYGLEGRLLLTTLGLLSPDKGIEYGIRAYSRFIRESCTDEQRSYIVYVIAGEYHPDLVMAEGGAKLRQYEEALTKALGESDLKWCRVEELCGVDFGKYDIVFLERFLDEGTLMKLYGATNAMILPYLNMQQISSGVLADTLGSGRVAVTTKFRYALELVHSNEFCPEGLVIGRYARGILVDAGEDSVNQIAGALDYLVFNKGRRLKMEKQAHQRGYQMRWQNSAWALLQHIEFIMEKMEIVTGRGITFIREKPSALQRKKNVRRV